MQKKIKDMTIEERRAYNRASYHKTKKPLSELPEDIAARKRANKQAYYERNRERINARAADRYREVSQTPEYKENKRAKDAVRWAKPPTDQEIVRRSEYYTLNRERIIARQVEWNKENPHRHQNRTRRKATPKWLSQQDLDAMKHMYQEAERLTRETGEAHHVDHLHPLKGKDVCGLHVPWNLRAIPATENHRKKNKMPEKFYGDNFEAVLKAMRDRLH